MADSKGYEKVSSEFRNCEVAGKRPSITNFHADDFVDKNFDSSWLQFIGKFKKCHSKFTR